MKKILSLFLLVFFTLSYCQKIDGLWYNHEVRKAILSNSLQEKSTNELRPLFLKISKNKVAAYLNAEPSIEPHYKRLNKISPSLYKDGLESYKFVNDTTLIFKNNSQIITFIRNGNDDPNDIFDTQKELTKKYLNFAKISIFEVSKQNQANNVGCRFDGVKVTCKGKKVSLSYKIYSANPYFFKKWNRLNYYMDIKISDSTESFLIEAQKNRIILKDLITHQVRYILR